MSMIREAIFKKGYGEQFEKMNSESKIRIQFMKEECELFLRENGFSLTFNESDILDSILKKLKKISDPLKLNRIYSFLFKDEFEKEISAVLRDKGIRSSNDIQLITSWVISTDSSLEEKRDFIKQISKQADEPIINLDTKGDFKNFSGGIFQLQDLILNNHPTLEQILHLCIDWIPGGSSGGGAASPGPGEGMLQLLSFNTEPIKKGDVKLGKFTIEVKGNVKGNDGGALAGGKGAKGWQAINEVEVIEKKYGVSLGNVDLRLINKTLDNDWVQLVDTIERTNGGKRDDIFRNAVLTLSSAYFSNSSSKSSFKNFTKNLKNISFDKMKGSSEKKKFYEIFALYNLEYYKEQEKFDYIFLVQYTERKCTFITDASDFWAVSGSLRIKYGDFKWDTPQGAFRLGLN